MARAISVVIPTRNRPELLARCLDRLAPGVQTLTADLYEVIVTDDGDDERTWRSLTERYPWCRYTAGPRRGPAANRNHGAHLADSNWIAFTDDDCVPERDWLDTFLARSSEASDVGVLEGKTTCAAGLRSPLEQAPVNTTGGYLWSCNMLVRQSVFTDLAGFDEQFPFPHMEDVDFRERLRRRGIRVRFVPEAIVDHPPRLAAFGWKLAAHQQSAVYHWYKIGNRNRPILYILWQVLRTRYRTLRRNPMQYDSLVAGVSLGIEIVALALFLPIWDFKYRGSSARPSSVDHGDSQIRY